MGYEAEFGLWLRVDTISLKLGEPRLSVTQTTVIWTPTDMAPRTRKGPAFLSEKRVRKSSVWKTIAPNDLDEAKAAMAEATL